jgi:hypothetical protein
VWPEVLANALGPHGPPHAQPLPLDDAADGGDRWLAMVGPPDRSLGAFRAQRGADGSYTLDPVSEWPTAVRVLGGVREAGVTYVLLESIAALDQAGGLHGVWIDGGAHRSPFEASPLALAGVASVDELVARLRNPALLGTSERNAVSLVAALRAASASPGALVRTLAAEGVDVGEVWQSVFVQPVGHIDGQGSTPSPLTDRVLAIVKGALETQACGIDACEAWTPSGHAVVRFVVQSGRWLLRSVLQDAAPSATAAAPSGLRHPVDASPDPATTTSLLQARARSVVRVVGEAPLTAAGGTIGVGMTDLAPDAPVVAIGEGAAARVFVVDQIAARKPWTDEKWDAAFADVDGDGRTDVVLRLDGTRAGSASSWTQVFLAPAPSVQTRALVPDLASAYAVMDASDARSAATVAASLPARAVSRDEACRVMATAGTAAGFRKVASPDARVLRFDQPGLPTWLPKIVPVAKVAADDVRSLGAHCAEMTCSTTRPYCAWSGGADSQHLWFTVGAREGNLAIAGAADYDGE